MEAWKKENEEEEKQFRQTHTHVAEIYTESEPFRSLSLWSESHCTVCLYVRLRLYQQSGFLFK